MFLGKMYIGNVISIMIGSLMLMWLGWRMGGRAIVTPTEELMVSIMEKQSQICEKIIHNIPQAACPTVTVSSPPTEPMSRDPWRMCPQGMTARDRGNGTYGCYPE